MCYRIEEMLAVLLALAAHPHGIPPGAPPDVASCIERGALFVASPDFFEELRFTHADGTSERAYQVLDRHDGKTGYLLILPASCRIVVLAVSPAGDGAETAQLLVAGAASAGERDNLLRWARFVPFDERNPAHAAWEVGPRPGPPRWLPGRPVPQQSAWRALPDGRWQVQRLARFARPIAWEGADTTDVALYVYPGRAGEAALAVYDERGDRFAVVAVVPARAVDSVSIVRTKDRVIVVGPDGTERVIRLP